MAVYPVSDKVLCRAELLLRLSLILVMFVGGLRKMFAWEKFVATASAGFVESPLPMSFVRGFLYCVPVIELTLGAWLLSGWRREWALFAVGILLLIFQFGHMMMQDFPGLSRVIVDLLLVAMCLCLPPFLWGVRPHGHDSSRRMMREAALREA
jgi:thiosulfate dehydrogenase [quinone] large subunit